MSEGKLFFYMKDINTLIAEATKEGGFDLGVVITPATETDKPMLQVSYFVKSAEDASLKGEEQFTNPIDGCPYPPRC